MWRAGGGRAVAADLAAGAAVVVGAALVEACWADGDSAGNGGRDAGDGGGADRGAEGGGYR